MLKVCLSHDIDRTYKSHQYLTKLVSSGLRRDVPGVKRQLRSLSEKKPYWKFSDFIEIESRYQIKSTVFFLNESIKLNIFKPGNYKLSMGRYNILDPQIVSIISWLDKNGWEIGVHGSYNSFNDLNLLKKEKAVLENIVQHKIIGIRQHYLNLNENTWRYQQEAGFLYDSSWGMRHGIGFRDSKFGPFTPFQDHFVVFPLVLMDTCFMELPDKWEDLEKLLDTCEQNDSHLVINFHQHVYNENDFPGFKDAYIKIIETCISRNASFMTLSEAHGEIFPSGN